MSIPRGTRRWLCALVGTIVLLSWLSPMPTAAYQLPVTSTFTPTHTSTPEHTDTPTATHTATHTPTPTPTHTYTPTPGTPTNTHTPTPVTPTTTHTPPPVTATPTRAATQPPSPRPTDEPPPSRPNPACQSSVQGVVRTPGGQLVAGATVTIRGDGWSNSILSDDQGRFGFAGLCAGSATLQATLPDGRLTEMVSITLSGSNQIDVTLGSAPAPAGPSATSPAGRHTARPVVTSEPEMPTTGSGSWLLIGGGALGVLLLLSATVRRALGVHGRN